MATFGFNLKFHGQEFELLPDRAIWWQSHRTLIIADLHLGKAATFRARGIPVPVGNTARDLRRLSTLIETANPLRLLILGDLIHAPESENALKTFVEWRQHHPYLTVALVLGNHDRHVSVEILHKAVDVYNSSFAEDGFEFAHQTEDSPTVPTVAGHLHPVVRLTDFDGSGIHVPCFMVRDSSIILPAFSWFTRGYKVELRPGIVCYAAAAGRVVPVVNYKS